MNKQYIILLFSFLLVGLIGCRKDSDVIIDTPDNPLPQIEFNATIQGVVTDRQGLALDGVQVTLGSETVETDINGVFIISDRIEGQRALLLLRKAGYFDLQKAVMASKKGNSSISIQLTQRTSTTRINASQGGDVEISGGSRVRFAPDSFEDEQGNAYSGEVSIYSFYIDPTDPEVDQFMPGDLTGFDNEDQLQGLQSFGMIKVELEGEAGQRLQINQPATLEVLVPATLQGQAPSAIPLWHYDEALGFWKEEGEALLQGNFYVGQVEHFSFWNCDLPSKVVFLEGILKSQSGEALQTKIRITQLSNNDTRTSKSSSAGYFGGLVPANEELLLEVFDNCNAVAYTQTLSPLNADTDLGEIILSLSDDWVSFTAAVVDCIGAPVSRPYIAVSVPGTGNREFFFPNDNGEINGAIATCSATQIVAVAYDSYNLLQGDPQAYFISPTMDFGTLSPCSGPTIEVITLEFNGTTYTIPYLGSFTGNQISMANHLAGHVNSYNVAGIVEPSVGEKVVYDFQFSIYKDAGPSFRYFIDKLVPTAIAGTETTYSVDGLIRDGVLIENGFNPGDTVQLNWENALIKEGVNGMITNEYPDGKISITIILQ